MARSTVPTVKPQRRLRSLAFVAEYLNVDERTVRRWIAAGHFKAYRLGNGPKAPVRIDLAGVESFLDSHATVSA